MLGVKLWLVTQKVAVSLNFDKACGGKLEKRLELSFFFFFNSIRVYDKIIQTFIISCHSKWLFNL